MLDEGQSFRISANRQAFQRCLQCRVRATAQFVAPEGHCNFVIITLIFLWEGYNGSSPLTTFILKSSQFLFNLWSQGMWHSSSFVEMSLGIIFEG